MAKYNTKREKVVKRTTTHQGGSGYTQTPVNELIGILSTGMTNNFYESETDREKRFKEVLAKVASKDKTFVAKALVYARTVFGQRSVTHFGAVELIPFLQGDNLGKRFFSKRMKNANKGGIIRRIDDMMEILAAYFAKNGNDAPIPNSIKKGFKDAIENADAYELAKYQMKNRGVSLIDIVNLVHPRETEKNGYVWISETKFAKAIKGTKFENRDIIKDSKDGQVKIHALKALVLGILTQFNTVEDKNTKAGQEVAKKVKSGSISKDEADKLLTEMKTDNFAELIKTKKIGYLALLRNLRNIIKTNDKSLIKSASNLLTNKDFIRKSLVWPHQIDLATEVLKSEGIKNYDVMSALSVAYENSIPNLKNLLPEGRTAVVYDTSGSMQGGWGNPVQIDAKTKIKAKPVEKAALIAATFAKGIDGDVYQFGTSTKIVNGYNPVDSINTIKTHFMNQIGKVGHGTFYGSIFPELDKVGGKYDRVIIITDEQGADEIESSYKRYSEKYGTPYVYFINITGYAPVMTKENNRIFRLRGYSADIYEKIPKLELNMNEVINAIKAIEI